MASILIVGCGAIGSALATELVASGHQVTGLKRHPPETSEGVQYFSADITRAYELEGLSTDFEHVFFILTADTYDDNGYKAIYEAGLDNLIGHFAAAAKKPAWILVSSTGVYGQNQGEWVDENSAVQPKQATTRWIRHAEQRITALDSRNSVVRFSGIYGPGRESLIRMAKNSPAIQKQPMYYTNRIHQADCVGVLVFLLKQRLAGVVLEQYYLASDHDPAPMWEVISWLSEQLRCPPPTPKTESGTDMNKRCSNKRLIALGYQFQYPDYKHGYFQILTLNKRYVHDEQHEANR